MKRHALTAAIALVVSGASWASEGFTNFNYGNDNPDNQTLWGTSKQESYDVAMRIDDPAMTGKMISEIRVPVMECPGIGTYSIWLSNELTVENKLNVPDVASYPCSATDGFISVVLDTPLEIPSTGIYVGYSFVMTELGTQEKRPLVVTEYTNFKDSFFIHTNRSYKTWKNLSESLYMSPVINVVVNGEFPENSLNVLRVEELNLAAAESGDVSVTVRNSGGNPVSSLNYEILIDGIESVQSSISLENPMQPSVFGTCRLLLPLPWDKIPNGEIGNHVITVEVKNVNSEKNASADNETEGNLNILSFVPVHKPVLEEYTGTWCGYCPRGYVGLEIMNHMYPEDFIGISIHQGDEMEVLPKDKYPNEIIGYPDSWLDRVAHVDAYSGYSPSDEFGIDRVWRNYRQRLAPADIDLTAQFTDGEETAVEINAHTTFAKKNEGDSYSQVFMLIGNGMTKENWIQSNNFSGDTSYLSTPYAEYWEQFVNGGGGVRGVVYNDILLAYTDIHGAGHEFPSEFDINTPLAMNHTFTLSEVVNVKGQEIVQDKNQLYAVVLLLNNATGAVENANKVKVGDFGTGVQEAQMSPEVEKVAFYDLEGRQIAHSDGICISRITYSDGSVKTEKILMPVK